MMNENSFTGIAYHYIREKNDLFPRIIGNKIEDFEKQIVYLKNKFNIIEPNEVIDFYQNNKKFPNKKNILITFDDGLAEHNIASKILDENGIKGLFFIPSCIVHEKEPANPMLIHYLIAKYGIKDFLFFVREFSNENDKKVSDFTRRMENEKLSSWEKISEIKKFFKYKINIYVSRKLLLDIFNNTFLKEYPNAMEIIHLTDKQIIDMVKRKHVFGTHSHSHISLGVGKLSNDEFDKEMIQPKNILEKIFNIKINSFSFPYGEKQDCITSYELLKKTNQYILGYTIQSKLNSLKSSPLLLGRYMPTGDETIEKLEKNLRKIFNQN